MGISADAVCLPNGVTTTVDAGSSGQKGFEKFKEETIDKARVRLLAFLNIVGAGMYGSGEGGVENAVIVVFSLLDTARLLYD